MKISSWANNLNPKVMDAHGDGSPSASQAPCTIVWRLYKAAFNAKYFCQMNQLECQRCLPRGCPKWHGGAPIVPSAGVTARPCPRAPGVRPHTGRRAGSCLQPASALIICLWHPNTPNYFSMQTVAVHLLRHQAGACRKYSNAGHVLISSENGTFYVC